MDSNRKEITSKLSVLVENRLDSQRMYWSSEVNFDKGTSNEKRIDFVGFKAHGMVVDATTVEKGTFTCFEVKSCMEDFKSGNGLTFYGDENYLVTTQEFAKELKEKDLIPWGVDAVLCPNKKWSRLLVKFTSHGTHRQRVSSEMLWAIVKAHG